MCKWNLVPKIWDWMVQILCSVFTQSVTVVGWGLSPRLMSPGLGCFFCAEIMYGCMEPNRLLFVEGP